MRHWQAVLAALVLTGAFAVSCDSPGPTEPPVPPPPTPPAPVDLVPGIVTPPSSGPAQSQQGSAKVWAHGEVDVTGPWSGLICYFWWGPHEQDKAAPDAVVNVPAGKTERFHFPRVTPTKPEHCKVQLDVATSCAKSSILPGLIADGYVDIRPCPTTTPTPPPCVDVYTGAFSVDYLSNAGTYHIKRNGVLWKDNLSLPAGRDVARFATEVDGATYCLWWKWERIGCAVAACGVSASWHGDVSYKCRKECVFP